VCEFYVKYIHLYKCCWLKMTNQASESADSDYALEALRKFRLIYGSSKAHFRQIEKACGLSGAQVWALSEIHLAGPLRLTVLAQRLSVKQPTCSNLIEKLVQAGLVEKKKDTQDSRAILLHITKAGVDLVQRAPQPLEGILPAALRSLQPGVLLELNNTLDQLIDVMSHADDAMSSTPLANF
jgi:DNA-binding MarR family transcriptional regulator